jgi:aminoglycoside phosphotransferase (APT) family kinase protein
MTAALRDSDDAVLRGCLERALAETRGARARVAELVRRPFAYETSYAIDELEVRLEDGERLHLLVKDVGATGLSARAVAAKPTALLEPGREIAVYRELLEPAGLSTPRFHGAAIDPGEGRWWLFLERVDGEVLTDVGALEVWREAAAWAGRLGAAAADGRPAALDRLLVHRDVSWHERRLDAALVALAGGERDSAGDAARRLAKRLAAGRARLVERLEALPQAFVHGELYPSNVVVERRRGGPVRIAPVDWELTGTGPFALDLAALVSGWEGDDRLAMCRAFHDALATDGGTAIGLDALLDAVALCRLALAVQWIGWAPGWTPPEAHRHDWIAEAAGLLDEVGL